MSYRPITDLWLLARPKVKYYGAYPNGFLERAKPLIGVRMRDAVLHVCGGKAKDYPNKRVMGPNDFTIDLDPALSPDFLRDVRQPLPYLCMDADHKPGCTCDAGGEKSFLHRYWDGLIIDRPYTEADAAHYAPGAAALPPLNALLKNALSVVRPGGRVGVIDYKLPSPPKKGVRFVACVGVVAGFDNSMRCYSVFEREYDNG